jgi:formylglycine-generating enzyme required for sulfatase activity
MRAKLYAVVLLAFFSLLVEQAQASDLYQSSHALVIGVSDYDNGWSRLPGVRADVAAVSDLLRQHGFEVESVIDEDKEEICRRLDEFLRTHGQEAANRLLIYYAGHAQTTLVGPEVPETAGRCPQFEYPDSKNDSQVSEQGILVMPDSPLDRAAGVKHNRRFIESGIRFDVFKTALEAPAVRSRHVMAVFDSCFSGSLFNTRSGVRIINPVERRSPVLEEVLAHSTRLYLTSGSAGQEVPDQSRFRRFFVEGLRGDADLDGDGYVMGLELVWYVRGKVTAESEARQTPMFLNMGRRTTVTRGEVVFESPLGEVERRRESFDRNAPERTRNMDHLGQFQDACPRCPVMVVLPGGESVFGSAEEGMSRSEEDETRETIQVSEFAISETPITVAQWTECFRSGGCDAWFGSSDPARARHPVTGLNYAQARQYVDWLNELTNQRYRLPTEQEWEYAARAGSTTPRPWGFRIGQNNAHCRGCTTIRDDRSTAQVAQYPPNSFGLYDMLGNVWEWTSSCWAHLPLADTREASAQECPRRVIRGGAHSTSADHVSSWVRAPYPQGRGFSNIGFRVVSDL